MHYVKFQLSPGQQSPPGSIGIPIPDTNWIVWAGEDGSQFPSPALVHEDMTAEEIAAVQPKARCIYAAKKQLAVLLDEQQAITRAVVLVAMDEINLLRKWLVDYQAVVAAAANLTAIKTGVAALPAFQPRTKRQLIAAITDALDSGEATS